MVSSLSPQKQQQAPAAAAAQQSPWKRPKQVSLVRTVAGRSMKRKCEALEALNHVASLSAATPLSPSNKSLSSQSLNNQDTNHDAAVLTPNNSDLSNSPKKIRRLGFNNRFSINAAAANLSMDQQSPASTRCSSSENDLGSFFFSGRRDSTTFNDSNISFNIESKKSDSHSRLSGFTPDIVQNICSTLLSSTSSSSELAKSAAAQETKVEYQFEDENLVPVDWSIKSKLRIVSTRKIACVEEIKSQHESYATWSFGVFNTFYTRLEKQETMTTKERNDLFRTLFCEATSYYMCPDLPWVNLYPRTTMSVKPELMLAEEAQKSLLKKWNTSFISVYNSMKNNVCPYFYMLTTTFTVLFKSPGCSQNGEMCAILTPSTKGLREAIQKENINFTMPLSSTSSWAAQSTTSPTSSSNRSGSEQQLINLDTNSQSGGGGAGDDNSTPKFFIGDDQSSLDDKLLVNDNEQSKKNDDDDDDDDDDEDEQGGDEETDEWLENLKLNNTVNFKSSVLQRNTKMSQKHSLHNFDHKPRSTLLFNQSIDVQALFNYLNNLYGSNSSNNNNCGGVPPTLLSPAQFIGSNLCRQRTERKIIKTLNQQNEKVVHFCLDLAGPILPFHVNRLSHLLRATQSGEFEMTLNPNQQTVAFNCDRKVTSQSDNELEINNFLLEKTECQPLRAQYGVYGECKSLRAIHSKDDKFCCVVE